MKKESVKPQKVKVSFYLLPDTPKKTQKKVRQIADLLCAANGGCSISSPIYPIKISISIIGEREELSCRDGWMYIYEFETPEQAKAFADDISLLKPVCSILYKADRFDMCFSNQWISCTRN